MINGNILCPHILSAHYIIFKKRLIIFLAEVKELADIIGKDLIDQLMNAETGLDEIQALQKCYYSLMNSSEKSVASALKQYEQRLRSFGMLLVTYLK